MKRICIFLSIIFISACQVVPKHLDDRGQDLNGAFTRIVVAEDQERRLVGQTHKLLRRWWADAPIQPISALFEESVLQAGDLLELKSAALKVLNGRYQVNQSGAIEVPYLGAIKVSEFSLSQAKHYLLAQLTHQGWLNEASSHLHLSVVEKGSIRVHVAGAIFNQGDVVLGLKPTQLPAPTVRQDYGTFDRQRSFATAIQSAGGVRPDADLSEVYLKRNEQVFKVNLSAYLSGHAKHAIPDLLDGDHIYVGSTGFQQSDLIRPTPLTPPGIRVFMSNLTAPALNNSLSAVGSDSTRLPYGVSLIDVAISANCIGGTQMANASRSILLITKNFGSQRQLVVSRRIDDLLAQSSNSLVNPFIMPNDAIACYDSRFTNFRDVARGLGELISPFILGRLL